MSRLTATVIDVGWGDSIFIESENSQGDMSFGLIDSNDTTYYRSSYIYLKKYFERNYPSRPRKPFDFVILSHGHADHGQGLKAILRDFGTLNFWYPKSTQWSAMKELIRFANRSTKVQHHQAIDSTKIFPGFGDVSMEALWPSYDQIDSNNENNNSIVVSLKLGGVSFLLTGDAEAEVWNQIASKIPTSTAMLKVPHHGSVNGTFDRAGGTPWFIKCPQPALLAISAHNKPFGHPDQEVINLFTQNNRRFFRTDEQYHLSFTTDGNSVTTKYSHI